MNILITGASRGIGFACVKRWLAIADCKIIALARNIEPLQTFLAENPHFSSRLFVYPFDIAQFDAAENLKNWEQQFTHLDILVNNAGLLIQKPFLELSFEDWQRSFEVNLFGVARLVQILFPYLQKSEAAHIVNIGSMGGFTYSQKFEGLAAYSTSKAALANLTECLAVEMSAFGIKSNCLCLGAVNTELMQQAFPNYTAQLEGKDIAKFIVDFALNGHKYMNGKVLPISLSTP